MARFVLVSTADITAVVSGVLSNTFARGLFGFFL